MSQSNNMKKSPGTESTGTPALRRSATRETSGKNSDVSQSPPVVRKSERLKRNSPEASATQPKTQKVEGQSSASPLRRSERGKNHFSSISNEKSEKNSSTSKVKGKNRSEARNYEKVAAKRRRLLDAKCFKALFLQEKNLSPEPSEKPKQLGKLAQSNCNATETEAEDEHRSVNNQRGNKLRKKIDKFIEHSDVFDGITPEIQIKEVCNVEDKEPNERNVDHQFPASRCEANTAELDSSEDVSTVPCKEGPIERDAEIHASVQDCPLSPSHDNRGSPQHVESDRLEVNNESHVKSRTAAATSKENLMIVNDDVEDEENIHCRDTDDINHIDVMKDSDPANGSEPACVSCSSNEANMDNTTLESGNILEESKNVHDTQKSPHLMLKPKLQKLCEVLILSEDVKNMAEQFLEYIMENHHVTREPVALLHAFQLSVCSIAASLRKQIINGRESLALAKKHLNFCCNEEDTDYVYLKMGLLKELFIQSAVNDKANGQASNTLLPDRYTTEDSLFGLNQVTAGIRSSRVFDAEKLLVKSVRQIKKKCRERMATLIKNQQEMIEELQKSSDEEKAQMEQLYKVEAAVVRSIHAHNPSMAVDKLKALEDQYSKRLEKHRNNLIIGLKSLEDKHSSERDKESELASSWTENIVKEHIELLRKLTRSDSEESKRICITNEQLVVLDGQKECCPLENQEVSQNQPGVLAGRVGACQSVILDDPSDLPSAASEAVNKPVVMNSVVSTSNKVLLEHSARVDAESGQVPCGQAACSLNLTQDTEVAESSSVDVPLHLSTSASTDGPSAGKSLDFPTASQQLSPSADLIPGSGLANPLIIVVPQSLSSDNAVGIRHDAEPQSTDPIVPLPPSPAAPGKEIDNSSPVPLLQADNGLPPTHMNVDMAATEKQPGLTSSAMTSRSEQSHSGIQPDQSLLHTAVDHCNVEPSAAEAVQQLPLVDSSSSQLSGLPSTQLNVEMPATEKQPGLPSSALTPISEQSDSDIQRDQSLLHTAVDHCNVQPSAVETVQQLPLVDSSSSQLNSSLPLLEEQPSGGIDFTPNADAPNPSPLPSVTRSQSTSIPGPRATNVMSGIATSQSGTTVSSTVSSRMPMFSYMDPLQSELERVQREADHSVKIYEEMKQQLHSEFDKEMAEIVAQIRKKYETTNVELDAAFKRKKDELDAYYSKVSMNRMLAEVFRNKCMEAKISVTPVMARENVQYQLPRLRPESAPRLPIFPGTSSAVQTSRNLQEAHTPGRPTVPSASSAAPTARILQSAQNPIFRSGPYAAASQNSLRPGSSSAVASQNSLHPGGSSVSASQNFLRRDGPSDGASQNSIHPGSLSAAASWNSSRPVTPLASAPLPAIQTSGTLHASLNPVRSSGTTPMSSLPRSTTSGSPAMQATMSRPVQVINRSSALFSNSSARPVNTASTTPSSVNLDSLSGSSSTPPHLRSRVSHPMAPNTTFSACPPSISSRPQYTSVSLPAPSTVNQQSSYHRLPAPQSANAPIGTQGLTMGTISALRMLSDIEKRVRNGTVVNLPHSQTAMPGNGPSQLIRPPNSGSNHNLPITSVSVTAQVVCLSDDE